MKKQYVIIDESYVRYASEQYGEDDKNMFLKILKTAQVYKDAEMTPVFLLDPITMAIYVVAQETFGKLLH